MRKNSILARIMSRDYSSCSILFASCIYLLGSAVHTLTKHRSRVLLQWNSGLEFFNLTKHSFSHSRFYLSNESILPKLLKMVKECNSSGCKHRRTKSLYSPLQLYTKTNLAVTSIFFSFVIPFRSCLNLLKCTTISGSLIRVSNG